MVLDGVLERFVKKSLVTAMARLVMQRAPSPEWVDELFEEHRERQYTRELLLSMVVELMALVALGLRPALNAAAQAMKELPVSVAALYEKVKRTEQEVVRALVRRPRRRRAAEARGRGRATAAVKAPINHPCSGHPPTGGEAPARPEERFSESGRRGTTPRG
jgi:hypothetical protein